MDATLRTILLLLLCVVCVDCDGECWTPPASPATCMVRSTCKASRLSMLERVLSQFIERNCFCDRLCHIYGDCCDDVAHSDDLPLDPETFTCDIRADFNLPYSFPVYMVERCPRAWKEDEQMRALCERDGGQDADVFLRWPVEDERGVMYRNLYCAQCHEQTNLTYWRSNITCSVHIADEPVHTSDVIQDLLGANLLQCNVVFEPPVVHGREQRYCKPSVSTCSPRWMDDSCDIRKQCEELAPTLYEYSTAAHNEARDVIYRNSFCARCNYDGNGTCKDDIHLRVLMEPVQRPRFFYPLSVILDLNSRTSTVADRVGSVGQAVNVTVEELHTCKHAHVYDPFTSTCRQAVCAQGYVLTAHGTCVFNDTNDCTRIALNASEFRVSSNGSLLHLQTGTWHLRGSFHVNGNVALVCTDLDQNYTETQTSVEIVYMFKYSRIQQYLSIVCQIISIIALTIQLIVYTLLPQLRNLPGKNLMCLSVSLLIAQSLFLFGVGQVGNYSACVVVAAVLHWSFLAAFFWMNTMSYDVWTTFSPSNHSAVLNHPGRRFIKYSIYSWGMSTLIVTLTLAVNFLSAEERFQPGYGEGLCWITHRLALLVFFAAPVCALILVNMGLYVSTVVNIWKVQQTSKLVRSDDQSDKLRFMLYVKLSGIMGLTWVFGFVATLLEHHSHIMWYLFIIFNGLQGAFLCLTFVCTRRVFRMLKEAILRTCKTPQRKRRDTETTSTSYLTKSRASSVSASPIHNINLHIHPSLNK